MSPDDSWYDDLVRDHAAVLRRYVARRVPPHDVDDVVSEVLVAAWRHREDRPAEPRMWLLRTASNLVLHEYRSQRRRERLEHKLAGQLTVVDGPDTRACDSDAADVVRACLEQLSPTDQELLRLVYWDQLGLAEAAFVLRATPVATRVRLHRARRRLAGLLPDWLETSARPADAVTPVTSLRGAHR